MSAFLAYVVVGLTSGSVYALAGTGLVLTFKTSGVFNFGHGAVAALGAYAFYELHDIHRLGWPWAALLCVAALGPAAGLALELLGRTLRDATAATRIVATVGLLLAVQGLAEARYGSGALYFPPFLPSRAVRFAGARIGVDQVIVMSVAAASAVGLGAVFRATRLGAGMRAVVDDPDLLALTGTDPVRVRRVSWAVGSSFAVLSGILIAPSIGLDAVLLTFLVVQAFGAAALGRFRSLPATYGGGLVIGVAASLATGYLGTGTVLGGLPASIPFLVLFVVLLLTRPGRLPGAGGKGERAGATRSLPPRLRLVLGGALAALALAAPALAPTRVPVFSNAVVFIIVFLSLALLVNVSGQVSLCHAALAASGATTFAHLTSQAHLPWLVALLLSGLAVVPVGAVVALPAVRLAGVYLALATFGLGILLERMVYPSALMFGSTGTRLAPRPHLLGLDRDTGFYYLLLVVTAAAAALVVGLRRARLGRLLRGLADDPVALGVLGTSTTVLKVVVFCLASFLVGIAGALFAALGGSVSGVAFSPLTSLVWLAVLAVGGRGLLGASVAAAVALAVVPVYVAPALGPYQSLLFGVAALSAALAGGHLPGAPHHPWAERAAWRRASGPVQSRVGAGRSAA